MHCAAYYACTQQPTYQRGNIAILSIAAHIGSQPLLCATSSRLQVVCLYITHIATPCAQVTRQRDIPDEKYTNAFTAFGDETTNFALEMTYNYGVDSYDIGEGFGHFGIAVPDVYKAAEAIRAGGGKVSKQDPCSGPCRELMHAGNAQSMHMHVRSRGDMRAVAAL